MTKYRIIQQKIVSPNGKVIGRASSSVSSSAENPTQLKQSVSVKISQNGSSSHSTSSCSSHSRSN